MNCRKLVTGTILVSRASSHNVFMLFFA